MFSESSIDVLNVLLEGLDSARWKRGPKKKAQVDANKGIDIKISVHLFKKTIKNSEWEILKSENLEIN